MFEKFENSCFSNFWIFLGERFFVFEEQKKLIQFFLQLVRVVPPQVMISFQTNR